MHSARLHNSDRLRRVLDAIADGAEYTTLEIMQRSHVCAVNSCIAELRENGYRITCQRRGDLWFYQLDTTEQAALRA